MDADLAVGPMMHRSPAQPVAVLQAAEHSFNALLTGVSGDDLFGRPVAAIGQEYGSSQAVRQQLLECLVVEVELQLPAAVAQLEIVAHYLAEEVCREPAGDLVADPEL